MQSANGLGLEALSGRGYCDVTLRFPSDTLPKWVGPFILLTIVYLSSDPWIFSVHGLFGVQLYCNWKCFDSDKTAPWSYLKGTKFFIRPRRDSFVFVYTETVPTAERTETEFVVVWYAILVANFGFLMDNWTERSKNRGTWRLVIWV